jgi:hypothetical protein
MASYATAWHRILAVLYFLLVVTATYLAPACKALIAFCTCPRHPTLPLLSAGHAPFWYDISRLRLVLCFADGGFFALAVLLLAHSCVYDGDAIRRINHRLDVIVRHADGKYLRSLRVPILLQALGLGSAYQGVSNTT